MAAQERRMLLLRLLRDPPAGVTLEMPDGVTDPGSLDLSTVVVAEVLEVYALGSGVVQLAGCRAVQPAPAIIDDDVFVRGWQDFTVRMVPEGTQARVRVPPAAKRVAPPRSRPTTPIEPPAAPASFTSDEPAVVAASSSGANPAGQHLPDDFEEVPDGGLTEWPSGPVEGIAEVQSTMIPAHAPEPAKRAGAFPTPVELHVNPTQPTDLFSPMSEDRSCLLSCVYDAMLMSCGLLLDTNVDDGTLMELLDIMRPAVGINAATHVSTLKTLAPSSMVAKLPLSHRSADHQNRQAHTMPPEMGQMLNDLGYLVRCTHGEFAPGKPELDARVKKIAALKCMRGRPMSGPYPFALRALLFAGAMAPLYNDDDSFAVVPEDVQTIIPLLQSKLELLDETGRICRAHGILISHEQQESLPEGAKTHFLESLAEALEDLDPEEDLRAAHGEAEGQDAVKYRRYVIERCLEIAFAPMKRLEDIADREYFTSECRLFASACEAAGVKHLQAVLGPEVGDWSSETTSMELTAMLAGHALCAPLFRELYEGRDTVVAEVPILSLVDTVVGTYDGVLEYAEVMSSSVPGAAGLVVAGVIRMISPALFAHWGPHYESRTVPEDFVGVLIHVHGLIQRLLRPHINNATIMSIVHDAVNDLEWVSAMLVRRTIAVEGELQKLFESLMMGVCWFESELDGKPHPSALDLFSMFHQMFTPIGTAITPLSNQNVAQYTMICMSVAKEYFVRVAGQLALHERLPVLEGEISPNVTGYLRHYRLNVAKAARMKSFFTQLDVAEVVKRLNTLTETFKHMKRFFDAMAEQHEELQKYVGGPDLDIQKFHEDTVATIDLYIGSLCEFLAMRVAHYELRQILSEFLVLDMKWYKAKKHDKKLLAEDKNGHLRYANEAITMKTMLDRVDAAMVSFLPQVCHLEAKERIVSYLYSHCATSYFGLLLEGGEERFFYPERSEEFFADFCYMESFFKSAASAQEQSRPKGPWAETASFATAMKCIITMVMQLPTDELIKGSERCATPFSDLPEYTHRTPFSKYSIRATLAHRKDQIAKRFTAANPAPDF